MTLDLWSDLRLRSRLVRVELGEVRVSAEVEPWWDAIPPSVMAIWACCKWCPVTNNGKRFETSISSQMLKKVQVHTLFRIPKISKTNVWDITIYKVI